MHFSAEVSETFRHQTHGAEMSWVWSVLGPKCPYTHHDFVNCCVFVTQCRDSFACFYVNVLDTWDYFKTTNGFKHYSLF